ncbi:ABC transporter ATP-binding protein [Heyndrickxia acidicola]|uniref:ABC transporter ATP-binding protein n=1 Tax=Heyndrickxia acidicola TaxID=209389 RepID=A0ABU6MIF3_9BACI|nr:ABC transporter ATP-binding protein [Heyndrickxia acidicola]MED1204454.1 ABC transporter ATP-binding protein [Heyndrickxia acidicola]
MREIVSVKNVSKMFHGKKAVDDVSFSIKQGEVTAILGPNGAGKSTTIHMLLGLVHPSEGEVALFGQRPDLKEVREKIGIMLQEVSVMPGLKVSELLDLVRHYYPEPLAMEDLVRLTGLTESDLKTMAEKLSGGQKRRLSFALALAGNPDLIVLDEPTVGMDTIARKYFWDTIHALAHQGKTIIFTTHYLEEADDTAGRILLFKEGRMIEDGSPEQIKAKLKKKTISFIVDPSVSLEAFLKVSGVKHIFRRNGRVIIHTDDTDRILYLLFEEKIGARDIQIESGKLEEAFEQLTVSQKGAI